MKAVWWIGGIIVAVATLAFAYWTISPFFRNIKVDEALPGTEATTTVQMAPETLIEEPMPLSPQSSEASPIVDTPAHPAEGTVRVVKADGKTYIRYENFKTLNGPDLFVYLAKNKDAKEFINLGPLKATEGNINYEVPEGVQVEDYAYVLVWCRAFGVLFNSAEL